MQELIQKGLKELQSLKVGFHPGAVFAVAGFLAAAPCPAGVFVLWEMHSLTSVQRQTVVSQFFQMDRLVVEGGISVRTRLYPPRLQPHSDKFQGKDKRGEQVTRQKEQGWA